MMPGEGYALHRMAVVSHRDTNDEYETVLRCLDRPCVIGASETMLVADHDYTLADLLGLAREHRERYHS